MSQPWMMRFALGLTAALAAVSVAVAISQPSADETGVALAVAPSATTTSVVTTTTTVVFAPPPTMTPPTMTPPTQAPAVTATRVTSPPPPTTAPVFHASGTRESCGWSWDATHFDDGSLNEVTLLLEAPRRPYTPVTITAKPGASPMTSFATTTDAEGYADAKVSLSNDKRDWTLTIAAHFPGSSCDVRAFTIAY